VLTVVMRSLQQASQAVATLGARLAEAEQRIHDLHALLAEVDDGMGDVTAALAEHRDHRPVAEAARTRPSTGSTDG
jgi:hypothetical protein